MTVQRNKKSEGESVEWNLSDPRVQKGLVRILRDLQALEKQKNWEEIIQKSEGKGLLSPVSSFSPTQNDPPQKARTRKMPARRVA